ncbi:unnamed protein product [Closterium sp. NIES-65]|nr:unnamed protein product [Closterium sp. NIES-65]
MMAPSPDVKVPDDRLGVAAELIAGPGTDVRGLFVYASTTGTMTIAPGDPVGLLVTGGAAGHRWGYWSHVGLLVTGGTAGHRWGCWSQARLPVLVPGAGVTALVPVLVRVTGFGAGAAVSVRRAGAQTAIPSVGATVIAKVGGGGGRPIGEQGGGMALLVAHEVLRRKRWERCRACGRRVQE